MCQAQCQVLEYKSDSDTFSCPYELYTRVAKDLQMNTIPQSTAVKCLLVDIGKML